jgi:DNA polymerase III alpha subunit
MTKNLALNQRLRSFALQDKLLQLADKTNIPVVATVSSKSVTSEDRGIDDLMTLHQNHKGIIHTTPYKQLNFIRENISDIRGIL